jgi:hypothetical protein
VRVAALRAMDLGQSKERRVIIGIGRPRGLVFLASRVNQVLLQEEVAEILVGNRILRVLA